MHGDPEAEGEPVGSGCRRQLGGSFQLSVQCEVPARRGSPGEGGWSFTEWFLLDGSWQRQ